MSINFKTPNLVIGRYNPGAGGKFIFNCLALSNGFVFQDDVLAQQQLDGKLSVSDKYKTLLDGLEQSQTAWNDLNMGCDYLFGDLDYDHAFTAVPETMSFKPIVDRLSNSSTRFCLAAHSWPSFTRILEVWPNAVVIFFENETNFYQATRRKYMYPAPLLRYWNIVRGKDWPVWPPVNKIEYNELAEYIRNELENMFHNEIARYIPNADIVARIEIEKNKIKETAQLTHPSIVWNCDWFLEESDCVANIQKLYEYFGLEDFNKKLITKFYQSWINCLKNIEQTNPMVWGTARYS